MYLTERRPPTPPPYMGVGNTCVSYPSLYLKEREKSSHVYTSEKEERGINELEKKQIDHQKNKNIKVNNMIEI